MTAMEWVSFLLENIRQSQNLFNRAGVPNLWAAAHYRAVAYLQLGRVSGGLVHTYTAQFVWLIGTGTCSQLARAVDTSTRSHIHVCGRHRAHSSTCTSSAHTHPLLTQMKLCMGTCANLPLTNPSPLHPLPMPDCQPGKVGERCSRVQTFYR